VNNLAISRKKKETLIETYVELLSHSQAVFLVNYRGMTVAEMTKLRRQLDQSGTPLKVVKNTLFKRALEQKGISIPDEMFEGPLAMGAVSDDVAAVAKLFRDAVTASQALQVRGGLLVGRAITADQVRALADLPPREVLLARVVGGLQAPIAGLVNVLNGPLRGLVYVLQARVDQLEAQA
jgi:large subunit ribosomal protein L10